jgi:predicted anti-sigma-YlaC factor YlaD
MNDHELVRPLLALSAAGLLDAEGERHLREHTAECEECRAELEAFAEIAGVLEGLPTVAPAPDLLWRTQTLMAAEADRRQGVRLAAVAGIFGVVLLLAFAAGVHVLMGDSAVIAWVAWVFFPSVLGGGAALTLASRRQMERSAE